MLCGTKSCVQRSVIRYNVVAPACVQRPVMGKSVGPRRRWKYISPRTMGERQGWVVQFQGRTIGRLHPTEAKAARTLMRVLGVKSMCDLPRSGAINKSNKLASRSAFCGVSLHKQKGVFVVNDARTGRTYSTDRAAAAARGHALGDSDNTEAQCAATGSGSQNGCHAQHLLSTTRSSTPHE